LFILFYFVFLTLRSFFQLFHHEQACFSNHCGCSCKEEGWVRCCSYEFRGVGAPMGFHSVVVRGGPPIAPPLSPCEVVGGGGVWECGVGGLVRPKSPPPRDRRRGASAPRCGDRCSSLILDLRPGPFLRLILQGRSKARTPSPQRLNESQPAALNPPSLIQVHLYICRTVVSRVGRGAYLDK